MSVGNTTPADWILTGGSGTSFTNFLSLLDTPVSYNAQAGKVAVVDQAESGLIFDNEKLVDLKDVNSDGLADNMVFVYDFTDGQTFKPQYRMDWKDDWAAGTYKTHSVVKDQGWVMISNKETTDRAAPQPDGNSSWALSDNPTWQAGQTSPIAIQGLRFTIGSEVVTIDGFRAWRATDTGNESYSYVIQDLTDEDNPTLITSGTLPQGPVGWVDIISSGNFFFEGQVIDIKFATEVSTSSSIWTHTWTLQDTSGGVPASGTYTHNADHTLLRISVDADGPTNVKSDLDQLKVGDTLLMFEFLSASRFNDYQVASAPSYSNGDTVLELPVVRIGDGQSVRTGLLSQGDASIKGGSLPASYTSIPNYWFLNPPVGGGTVNGYLISNWNAEPSLNDDAFGLDIRGHGWITSDDWDVITTIVGGGGGSSGGGSGIDQFRQLVDTPNSYTGEGNKVVAVKADETGLEFVEGGGGGEVESVFGRTGNVVAQTGDYSAAQVGADTSQEVTDKDTASIAAHVGETNPHPQYLTSSDLPTLAISYFTGVASVIDASYLLKSPVILGNVENSVSAISTSEDVPVLIGQWLGDPVFQEDGTLLETGSDFTLDYDASADFTDLRIEVGVRSTLGVYTTIASQDFSVNQGRSVSTFTVTVPETDYFAGETSFSRMYVIKRESGGNKELTIYQEGSYVSRTLTAIPVASLPAPHAASHEVGGSDQVNHDNLPNAQGFKSHSQIDTDLADHESRIGVNESDIVPLQQNSPPASGKVAGRFLAVANSGIASFTINDTGSYNTDGTFRFTQKSTSLSGQGVFGDAIISGNILTSITVLRSTGHGYALSEVVELDIPDAGENVSAKIAIDALGVGQEWQDIVIPPSGVTSFNTRTGAVVSETGDYNADQIDDAATTKKFATQAQLDQIATNTTDIAGKEDEITATTTADYYQGDKTFQPKLGLPISTATQTALDGKEDTLPLTTRGDILVRDAANATARLPIGTNNQVLTSDGTDVSWQPGGGGGTFDSLTDTPNSKANNAGYFVTVNAAGTELEYSGSSILWTPKDLLVEPISWVDASDESTITESGGNVSLIADKTSNGNNLEQGNGSNQPETGQTLNGLNVLTFDHTTADALVNNTFPIPTSRDISVFTVQSYTAGGGEFDSLFSMDSSTRDWQISSGSGTQFNGRAYTSGIGGNSTQDWVGGPFNGPSIYNAYFNRTGNGRGAYVDGVEVTTEEVYTTGMDASQILRIMANRAGAGSISGILAEMVIVEDQSVETRQLIEGYLKWKWNLAALPSGHPYEFAPPTIAGSGGGFTNLRDTPRALGAPGQYVKVNGAGDGLEFGDLVSSASGPMDGGFTSGTWKLYRSGDNITFSFYDAALTVADTSASSTALIPEEMRPPSNITDMYNGDASSLFHCEVTTGGVFTVTQRNYDGTQTAITAYGSGSITWLID